MTPASTPSPGAAASAHRAADPAASAHSDAADRGASTGTSARSTSASAATARPPVRVAVLLGLLAAAISAAGSWIPSFWGDEAASVMSAQRPLPSLFHMVGHIDAVHGLYYLGLHFWIDLFGASPFSTRLPSALAVGAMVAGVVLLVDRLGTRRLAVIAGIVAAVLPRVTSMGTESRSYAIGAALAVWSTWALVRIVTSRHRASRADWVVYGVLAGAGVGVFVYFGLIVGVHALLLLALARDARPAAAAGGAAQHPEGGAASIPEGGAAQHPEGGAARLREGGDVVRAWVATVGVALLAVSPIVVFSVAQRGQVSFLARRDTTSPRALLVELWFGDTRFAVVAWALVAVAVVALAAGLLHRARDGWSAALSVTPRGVLTVTALLLAFVPAVALLALNLAVPAFSGRYLSFSAPAVAILVAIGIDVLASRRAAVAALGVAVVVGLAAPVWLDQRGPYAKNATGWQDLSALVGEHAVAGDALVFDESPKPSIEPRLALHTYPDGFEGLRDVTLKTPFVDADGWRDDVLTVPEAAAAGRFDDAPRVWFVEYVAADGSTSPKSGLRELLGDGYAEVGSWSTHRARLVELER
ncbi:glycosyltransferase family 39 protein [Frigoribacterium sp. CFBP9039]|uniref:glycosyltransferase family 39 protein n=1 Tax=Frigoribacterium sp. CFBP9029 TaxID=3096541 RepID=UPI002A6AB6BD|nr:glycosyltransferase family 39 protein [Frigoribacterium sp. CFBP9039]MDY0945306.1 glycosyltransferase family 39 protein [Frigoribacterium sp. CFBP9039]